MSEHYTEDRKYSYIHNAWILESSWNDKEEIAKLNHEIAISKRDYDVIYKLYNGLEEECAELRAKELGFIQSLTELSNNYLASQKENAALKVQMSELREVVDMAKHYIADFTHNKYFDEEQAYGIISNLETIYFKTSNQSLAARDNEVIEMCAKIAESYEPDEKLKDIAYASRDIRNLKTDGE